MELPYQKSEPASIQSMFSSVAYNYDRANQVMSLGMSHLWNRKLLRTVAKQNVSHLLDLCAGTGAVGLNYLRKHPHTQAILLDFCPHMLEVAQERGKDVAQRFKTLEADAQELPLEDASVDGATIAYGIRNVKEPPHARSSPRARQRCRSTF